MPRVLLLNQDEANLKMMKESLPKALDSNYALTSDTDYFLNNFLLIKSKKYLNN